MQSSLASLRSCFYSSRRSSGQFFSLVSASLMIYPTVSPLKVLISQLIFWQSCRVVMPISQYKSRSQPIFRKMLQTPSNFFSDSSPFRTYYSFCCLPPAAAMDRLVPTFTTDSLSSTVYSFSALSRHLFGRAGSERNLRARFAAVTL